MPHKGREILSNNEIGNFADENRMYKKQQVKYTWLFYYLLTLTTFFILLEISFFIQASHLYLGVFSIVTYHLKIPARIYPAIAYYLLMQLLLHVIYLLFIFYLTYLNSRVFRLTQSQTEKIGILLWTIGISIILLTNQLFYPDSKFAILTAFIFPPLIAKILLMTLATFFSAAIVCAFYGIMQSNHRFIFTSLLLISIFFVAIKHYYTLSHIQPAGTAAKPNIIIIGVDAARSDFLGFFGGDNPTPHFDNFLNQSTVFSESLTPLARTYPAWASILTGQFPKKSGIRFDLAERIDFDVQQTLPAILKRAGYQTIYATDETRFSNIDQRFGFEQVITPPIGFNDFLLGSFNDFPLSNLVVNTFLGRYLFPYSYANRAAYITYYPTTFLNYLQTALSASHPKPIFLAVHFCLTHYPYIWAGRPANTTILENYKEALNQVDLQLHGLLQLLKQNKLLEHSVVVLLSDHGEAFELNGDRITEADLFMPGNPKTIPHFYPPSEFKEHTDQSGGHGTDVLGLTQYHTLLAFKLTGTSSQDTRVVSGRVSLLDIKPTLLDLLHLSYQPVDGKSLLKLISGQQLTVPAQPDFFTETDFTPEAVRSVNPETRKIIFEGIEYIQINPVSTRLSIRPSMVNLILSSKQYADFYGPWVLALYPQTRQSMTPVLVNLETGNWTTDLHTTFAKQAPIQHMLHAMEDFYGQDITSIHPEYSY